MKRLTTFIAGAAVAATLGGCQQPAVSGWKSFSGDKNIERRGKVHAQLCKQLICLCFQLCIHADANIRRCHISQLPSASL